MPIPSSSDVFWAGIPNPAMLKIPHTDEKTKRTTDLPCNPGSESCDCTNSCTAILCKDCNNNKLPSKP